MIKTAIIDVTDQFKVLLTHNEQIQLNLHEPKVPESSCHSFFRQNVLCMTIQPDNSYSPTALLGHNFLSSNILWITTFHLIFMRKFDGLFRLILSFLKLVTHYSLWNGYDEPSTAMIHGILILFIQACYITRIPGAISVGSPLLRKIILGCFLHIWNKISFFLYMTRPMLQLMSNCPVVFKHSKTSNRVFDIFLQINIVHLYRASFTYKYSCFHWPKGPNRS